MLSLCSDCSHVTLPESLERTWQGRQVDQLKRPAKRLSEQQGEEEMVDPSEMDETMGQVHPPSSAHTDRVGPRH